MGRSPIDRDAKGGPGGSLPNNVMKLKAICREEGIDPGEARKASEYQAAIIAGRCMKAVESAVIVDGKQATAEPQDAPAAANEAGLASGGLEEIENIVPGSRLHLGDGRSILFGETADVGAELAATLRGRGQVK